MTGTSALSEINAAIHELIVWGVVDVQIEDDADVRWYTVERLSSTGKPAK